MTLVMFDVDGTLTRSNEVDSLCFVRATEDVFGIRDLDEDWSHYRHTSDLGIIEEIFEQRFGRLPDGGEVDRFRRRFLILLEAALAETPMLPIAGAGRMLAALQERPDTVVALASGAWRDSARAKVLSAGLPFDRYPGGFAEEGPARVAIMEAARARASQQCGRGGIERWIYFGDAIWDARACRELGIPLLGIAGERNAGLLRQEGAREVFRDYSRLDELLNWIDRLAEGTKPASGSPSPGANSVSSSADGAPA